MSKAETSPRTVPINAEALREMRKLAGMNGKELADRAGISQPYLCQIELGKRDPSPVVAKKLADALGVSIGSLFSRPVQSCETAV